MKLNLNLAIILLMGLTLPTAEAQRRVNLPDVVILTTNGTIAGKAAGQAGVAAMINAVPEARKLANLTAEHVSDVGPQDMTFDVMLRLANRINQITREGNAEGVVVTHCADVIEETAYFLNLVVKTDKPVVMVCSFRPGNGMNPDGLSNLYDAIAVAADRSAAERGVMVVNNGEIHSAQSLVKFSTTPIQPITSPIQGLIGTTHLGNNHFYRMPLRKWGPDGEFSIEGITTIPRVDVIYADAGMGADLIDASVKNGAKGIVIAGVGNGNMPKAATEAARRAVRKGVAVVRSSRVASSNVKRNGEIDDDETGTIASYQLNPQKSRILLGLALLQQPSSKELQRIFTEY